MGKITSFLSLLVVFLTIAKDCRGVHIPIRNDETSSLRDKRVQEILDGMSLMGKIGQMTQININEYLVKGSATVVDKQKLISAVQTYGIGSILNSPTSNGPVDGISCLNATQWIQLITDIQDVFMNYFPANLSSIPIPMLYGLDSVHGANYVYGATLFPHNTGAGATFNPDLIRKAAEISAKDTRTAGVPWAFSPVLGIGVQPLWPRLYETFGEDPVLGAAMGAAAVKGYQGKNVSDDTSVACCLKHFLGYPDPKSGKDRSPAWIPDRMLYRYFVPPFATAIETGASSVMINSAEINGIPVHASKQYLTDLLRSQLQFQGLAVSDWSDIERLVYGHRVAPTMSQAIKMAVEAGVDMSMVPSDYSFPTLLYQLAVSGEINVSRIEEAARRIISLKVDLGLFDTPYPDINNPNIQTIGSLEDRNVSLDMARESVTLLKNNGILPLSKKISSILVTGPCGDSITDLNGGWTIHWQGAVSDSEFAFGTSIFKGIQGIVNQDTKVVYVEGADFDNVTNLSEAVEAARNSEAVILCAGEAPEAETPGCINDLTLSDSQQTLISAIAGTGTPVILVLVEPRPRILAESADIASAILMTYLPGSEGGQAIAEIIFGDVNPSGKLPLTYPQFTGDVGVNYYHKYTDITSPLFPFGFGMSYSTFDYSNLSLDPVDVPMGESVNVSVVVTNSGSVEGKEVVLLYLSDLYASVTPEVKMLKHFQKIYLKAGQSQQVQFTITSEDMSFIGINNQPTIEAGDFMVTIGTQNATFTLLPTCQFW